MYDELWQEIQDSPGEIFDIPELQDEKFDVNEYLNSNYDYWNDTFHFQLYWWRCNLSGFRRCHLHSHHRGERVSFLLQISPEEMTDPKLEMLSAREQLMSDIECIVESLFWDTWGDEYVNTQNELIKTLCDSVCANFPSNW